MSSTNSVAVYEILIRNSQIKGRYKYAPLGQIPDGKKSHDLMDIVQKFGNQHTKYRTYLVNKGNRIVKISNVTSDLGKREISFFVHQGSYGTKSEIVSSKSLSKTYDKLHDEGDAFAHFVYMKLPAKGNRGFIIFHMIGNIGVKSWFRHYFETYIQSLMTHCGIILRPLASEEVLNKWLKDADVKAIRIAHFEPNNADDPSNYLNDENVEKTLVLSKPGGNFGKLSTFLNSTKRREKIVALSDPTCSGATAEVVWNGRSRSVSLDTSKNPKAKFVLDPKDVTFNAGIPDLKSITNYSRKLIIDLEVEIAGGA